MAELKQRSMEWRQLRVCDEIEIDFSALLVGAIVLILVVGIPELLRFLGTRKVR